MSGKVVGCLTATKVRATEREPETDSARLLDLGFVGEPSRIDRRLLDTISAAGMIPVVAPIGIVDDGHTYNINADTMAVAVSRSEERRVGKVCVRTCRSVVSTYPVTIK